ncbi:immunoglobulin I-set domain protein [Streptomyces spinoverrucosus]|uniref:immunoglobulin I-set domain protein n=1 Tax=Streptomyces spinoverrucosus TaxID=284043 RepID=UPI0018C3D9EC|nr:immunoglobulin I-set domain protein [Streptomyces spinoverrucosus]MBG0857438.1 immunoglobulin I-set domain protein [Streptomyces spinoverrucosus]
MTDDTTDRNRADTPARPRLRRPAALLGAAALVAAGATAVTVGSPAQAADTPRTALGKDGQKLTVSASANLDPDGETLRVTGEGYDATKGIYVALCKDNGDNRIPTPCLGGADQTGGSGASKWIVPEGDPNEGELTETYGDGGTFDVEIEVKAEDGGLDCTQVACSVVTRVDHRAAGDRSQDVRVPVAFEGQDPGDGDGGDGVDVPAGTVSYVQSAEYTTAGQPLDVLLHPDSGKLYVGSENVPDTSDVNEAGLYVLDPADGTVRGHIAQAPGSTGTMAARPVHRIIAPLAGDGVVFQYPVRGIGTAKDGDTAAKGVWPPGGTVTAVGPGTEASTVLIAQGAALSEVEYATGTVRRTLTLDGASAGLGVDGARGVVWSGDATGGQLRRVDTRSFTVTATADLPADILTFVEVDPQTGNVWVGTGYAVLVFDKDGKRLAELKGRDRPMAVAFDATTGAAFVLRGDYGSGEDGSDNVGSLDVYGTATFEQTAQPVALPGTRYTNRAGVAVTPGAASVYLTNWAESEVVRLDRRMSPKLTQAPTDQSVTAGDKVTLVAAADGTPKPTPRWQVSPDGGQTWSTVEGATENAYSFTAKEAHDGYRYRAEFTNSVGTTRTSPITLTVAAAGGGDDGGDGGQETKPSGTKTVTGPEGQKLTVTPVNNLATADQTLTVTGSGYDVDKGIYVALCVDNGAGELPTPCVGGVDMTGTSHSSAWISSNPPDYGEDLAIPYGEGGTFQVELTVDAKDEFTDCFKAKCVLATRADHTLSGDRSQDVKVPVSFVGQDPVDTDDGTGDGGGTGGTDSGGGASGGSTTGGTGTGGTGTTTTSGGSLASTGTTVGTAAALAALLTATGWYVHRRARGRGAAVESRAD